MFSCRLGYAAHLAALSLHRHIQVYPSLSWPKCHLAVAANLVEVLHQQSDWCRCYANLWSCAGIAQSCGASSPTAHVQWSKEPTNHIWSGHDIPQLPRRTTFSATYHVFQFLTSQKRQTSLRSPQSLPVELQHDNHCRPLMWQIRTTQYIL